MPNEDHPLRELCGLWLTKIKKSLEHKKKHFQDDADTAFRFFNGPHDFMYEMGKSDNTPLPSFRMTLNKVAEMVQIFGPALYHTNPTRKVSARPPLDLPLDVFGIPMVAEAFAQQDLQRSKFDDVRASILERVINWAPVATNLRAESRASVDEALIKGMGVLWTELWQPPGATFKIAGSFHDSVDHLAIDPDMESMDQSCWIARRCCHPVWQVEREYGHRPGSLKGNTSSQDQQATMEHNDPNESDRRQWASNDLICYWKIYSRMGIGSRLSEQKDGGITSTIDIFGDYVYLVVAAGVPYPLNLPPELQRKPGADGSDPAVTEAIVSALQWPIPTWAAGMWPVSCLSFHRVPKQVWPMSHLKPAMGELKFLNWAYSFVAAKIKNTSRDFLVVLQEASDQIKEAMLTGDDMVLLELQTQYQNINQVVQFLTQPEFNASIWPVIQAIEGNLEKRLGLNELSYGSSDKQIRSAAEADIKSQGTSIRPDDMAEQVEAWMAEAARKESMMNRLYLRGGDVKPVLGDIGAMFWDQFVATPDVQEAAHEFSHRIESGSIRKPNRERDAANYQAGMQILLPVFQSFAAATGYVEQINALIKGWCVSKGIDDFKAFLFPPPPPPPDPMLAGPGEPPPGGPPGPGGLPPQGPQGQLPPPPPR